MYLHARRLELQIPGLREEMGKVAAPRVWGWGRTVADEDETGAWDGTEYKLMPIRHVTVIRLNSWLDVVNTRQAHSLPKAGKETIPNFGSRSLIFSFFP